ncbi:hypothetical protein [Pseudomonas sp. Ga0074129]|uniref:hypothetical protein n=1 Tax=Pseudomonas sp. Ga0074129 TaxID=1752219 RepID=UPI000A53AA71|nr:hypothetical protein [Pseudomonas sp. Ga0074129]
MHKPIEQRYPSGPATVGEQKPGGKHATQPYYKANTIFPDGQVKGSATVIRQEQQPLPNPVTPAPLRSVKRDEAHPSQESDKS